MTPKTIPLPTFLKLLQPVDFPHKLGLCDRVFSKSLAAHGVCWVRTSAGLDWKLDLSSHTHRWIVYGKYEGAGFLNWAKRHLAADGVVVDSGANIGQMLLYLAQWTPRGKVLAFEPNAHSADWLAECLRVNPALSVEVIRCGLGDTATQLWLQDEGAASKHGAQSFVSESAGGTAIEIARLADALAARRITQVDLWKLDVEGYELPALRGAQPLLERQAIKAVYVEMRDENGLRINDYLKGFGYACHALDDKGRAYPVSEFPEDFNGLFLPRD